jgi:hypothetical protein
MRQSDDRERNTQAMRAALRLSVRTREKRARLRLRMP